MMAIGSVADRQRQRERRARAERALDADVAAHQPRQAARDGEAEPGAAVARACCGRRPARIPRRSTSSLSAAMPIPVSATATLDRAVRRPRADLDAAARRELRGVAQQVDDDLAQLLLVDDIERKLVVERLDLGDALLDQGLDGAHALLEHRRELRPRPGCTSIRPASTLARSRIALMSESRCCALARIFSRFSYCFGSSRSCERRITMRVKPMIALSGVRSSCDMLARNALLCRLATSSCRLFSSISRYSRAFWIASADCVAKLFSSSITSGSNSPGRLPVDDQPAEQPILAQQRHREQRPIAQAQEDLADPALVHALVHDVADRHRLAGHRQPPDRAFSLRDGRGAKRLDELVRAAGPSRAGETPRALPRTRRSRRRPCWRAGWHARRSCSARSPGRASSSPPGRPRSAPAAAPPNARAASSAPPAP